MSRRHKLASEASARFERGVDPELPVRASARAATMLAALSGGTVIPGYSIAGGDIEQVTITMAADYPDKVAGVVYGLDTVLARLREVGCTIGQSTTHRSPEPAAPATHTAPTAIDPPAVLAGGQYMSGDVLADHGKHDRSGLALLVTPPSWRPDITDPADVAEEVIRLEGYQNIPVRSVRAAGGRGLTSRQRLRRAVGRALASQGFVEVLSSPFTSTADFDRLQLSAEDPRRRAVRLANPLSDDEPLMRTTLLPGLFRTLVRNLGRGFADVSLYESGLVFRPRPDAAPTAPILRLDRAPAVHELAQLEAALPDQPLRVGVVLTGHVELPGYWGGGRTASWQDAIEAARVVLRTSRLRFDVRADQHEPWHPGRCAALFVQTVDGREWLAGHAGELHPRVIAAFGLPPRTAAMELDMSVIEAAADALPSVAAPELSAYPLAVQDVALVVPEAVAEVDVERALADGVADAGDVMLESLRLFDIYTGAQIGEGYKSLAYTLRFRAADRTLTAEEANAAREAAVAEATRRTGAVLRGAS